MKDLILKYFDAFANLYGIIPMKRAYRIIEKQNPELNLTKEQFAEIVNTFNIDGKYYDILSKDQVYDENAEDGDLFDKLLMADYIWHLVTRIIMKSLCLTRATDLFMCRTRTNF